MTTIKPRFIEMTDDEVKLGNQKQCSIIDLGKSLYNCSIESDYKNFLNNFDLRKDTLNDSQLLISNNIKSFFEYTSFPTTFYYRSNSIGYTLLFDEYDYNLFNNEESSHLITNIFSKKTKSNFNDIKDLIDFILSLFDRDIESINHKFLNGKLIYFGITFKYVEIEGKPNISLIYTGDDSNFDSEVTIKILN